MPPSVVAWMLWPPLRTASSSPDSRARYQGRDPGQQHHPREAAPVNDRGADVDKRHEEDERREKGDLFGVDPRAEGGKGRDRDAQSGRPTVHQHVGPATVGVRRAVVCGAVTASVREVHFVSHGLCSDPR
jgi:hypothetical protein